jgi:translocation and assembly module TamB
VNADAGVGWDSVKAWGFDMGPGEFTVKLANGRADISPIHANFGDGKISLSPAARFDPEPAEFGCAKGKIIDRAKLTPAATAGALGYALPAIANAAQASGEISAILDDNRIPLADVTKAYVKGQLVIHKATIGPGPVITEIMKATGSANTVMTLANEVFVPVRVEGGRVYHENFAITVNNYTIRTSGSAGFDGSLAMVAEVPIPGTLPLLKNNPVLKKALEGKIVKVPLAGTVAKPTLDPNFFATAVSALARDAMKGVGKEILNRELEKLFPPIPKKQ